MSDPATTQDIIDAYVARYHADHVHRVGIPHFSGHPGHHYIVPRRPTNVELARMSAHSGNAEVALVRINSTFVVSVGNHGIANVSLAVPQRDDRIESFEWIAHPHPLELENQYEAVARGPTTQDRDMLRIVHARWRQTTSVVIVCRGGRIVDVVPFQLDSDRPSIHVVIPGDFP